MNGLCVEHLPLDKSLSSQLVRQICLHAPEGKLAIVTDKPEALLAAARKQWLKHIRRVRNERSSTLNPVHIHMLNRQLAWMQGLSFSSKAPDDMLVADVTFATADDFVRIPPVCRYVYITYVFEIEKLYMLTSWMPRGGLVVIYEQK